jgi:hypothetical protein
LGANWCYRQLIGVFEFSIGIFKPTIDVIQEYAHQIGSRIGRDDESAFALVGIAHGVGAGHAGFTYPALAGKNTNWVFMANTIANQGDGIDYRYLISASSAQVFGGVNVPSGRGACQIFARELGITSGDCGAGVFDNSARFEWYAKIRYAL